MFKNKLWLTILSILTSIILLAVSIVNILQLCEVGNFRSYNHALHISSTVISLITIILLLGTVFGSAYTFSKKGLLCNIGLIFYTIPYEKILNVKTDASKSILIMYVQTDKNGDVEDTENNIQANILPVNISNTKIDQFVKLVKENNNSVIYEISPYEVQKKKDKKEKK